MLGNASTSSVHISRSDRFHSAVETFVDLYRFVMALAIGNCFRSIAQRQIQNKPDYSAGIFVHLANISLNDGLMFAGVLIFIARYYFGDMAYWKTYAKRYDKIHLTDAANLLLNSFALTYMSFFIGYNRVVLAIFLLVLVFDVFWGAISWGDKRFRTVDGPQIEDGVVASAFFLGFVVLLSTAGIFPNVLKIDKTLSPVEDWWIFGLLCSNNIIDLYLNGCRYLGGSTKGRRVWRRTPLDDEDA